MEKNIPYYDVVVVGAGLSGIGAGYHMQHSCADMSYTILEARAGMGGTWDLFQYPGIRSDSDMYTLGFPFSPWKNPKAIADGPAILEYIRETARKFGIDQKIQYHHKVIEASWSDDTRKWTLTIAPHEQVKNEKVQCRFLLVCSGYYDYESGYLPEFAGYDDYRGILIHPQHWPRDFDYSDKTIIVIGSGATAVTLVPELAKKAAKVVMLQRTPTYIISLPRHDRIAEAIKYVLPQKAAYHVIRWKNILLALGFYEASRRWPYHVKQWIQKRIRQHLGENFDMRHFTPPYNPWDQRLCIVPDADLFDAIKCGKAEIVTDQINRFTEKGILLQSGRQIEADIIVTATGLKIKLLGGMTVRINGLVGDSAQLHVYRGVMLSDVPNFAFTVGYTNASWTLKCDLSCRFVTRLLRYMKNRGYSMVIPRFDKTMFQSEPLLDFNSGYVLRALHYLPKQGSRPPWKVYQNYVRDLMVLSWSSLNDPYLEYR